MHCRMLRFPAPLGGAALAGVLLATSTAAAQVAPHRSATRIPSSNGRSVVIFDTTQNRVATFREHPYAARSDGAQTRDFAFDTYPGIRVGGAGSAGTWLTDVQPSSVAYENGTGIIRVDRTVGDLEVATYHFSPIDLAEHASVMLVKVERTTGTATPVDVYGLYNFHLGNGAPDPDATGETIFWDAPRDAWIEFGPSGAAMGYGSIGASTHRSASPDNPFPVLTAGGDLSDNAGTGGTFDDAAAGLQWSLGSPASGTAAWAGSYVVLDSGGNVAPRIDAMRTWIAGRTPEQILSDEKAAWDSWHVAPPAGLMGDELSLYQQSMAILRMGQVSEPGKSDGQILASMPPGMWNIAWVRDMAYAVVALARSGHPAEAKRAIEFQLGADSSNYEAEVGRPYRISITRYFGDGVEETDFNQDGPNIEFDGFGLFLWTVDEYVQASSDEASLTAWWPTLTTEVADVLVSLQESTGLIAPDSSIWEVHWNGKQKRFAYTTITAANGLCRAATLAERLGDTAKAAEYRDAGRRAQAAVVTELTAPDGTIAQSLEELQSGSGFLDAAAIEAVGLGLIDPTGTYAAATFNALKTSLVPPSGRGFFRNDDGGWYDNQEWVFVDLRIASAMRLANDPDRDDLLAWITAQGNDNYGLISELHGETTGDYEGEVPMVGFGAGAYAIALLDRENPVTPMPCGEYADGAGGGAGSGGAGGTSGAAGSAAAAGMAGGAGSGGGGNGGTAGTGATGGTTSASGGTSSSKKSDDSGCGCRAAGGTTNGAGSLALLALFAAWRRRR